MIYCISNKIDGYANKWVFKKSNNHNKKSKTPIIG